MKAANRILHHIIYFDAHQRLLISVSVGGLSLLIIHGSLSWIAQAVIAWVSYASTALSLTWTTMLLAHPADICRMVQLQDAKRSLIYIIVVVAAMVSLFAVMYLISSVQNESQNMIAEHIILSLFSISCSWFLVHTLFTIHYAHIYYDSTEKGKSGGLDFPGGEAPDYLDFAYFSFVIGMTSQVSDVQISSKPMRRLALLHGLLSFLFNALIVALTINTVSGLLGR
ncbi:DUF1345 domain-containing protein [Arsenicibacter rosenii]|uniref:DUF1345 domain-containing protein n=1 Tax=Arsenicibacter rosenii TaxID=1750698 RepID=A0A1S2VE29_9BACT|nr:DUF1345 domain-containing protein [Arsenicibacter rosenii]OIN56969.1 hypothetical protein BLX24_21665 [Arsenicibacter rosenii]